MKSISIKSKVITLILLSLAILAVSISTFAIYESKTSFMEENFHKLESMRDSKAIQLEKFFEERVSDIKVLAKSENIKNLVTDLIFVHKELKVQGNENYPVENELAKNQIQRHESFFKSYMNDYGYYDVFVICAKHGHVMYSAAKESDHGQNLVHGDLKTSALAKVWNKVKETKKISFVDMEPYAPSNGNPAMFVGAPVFLDGVFRSVLVFQVSDKSINSIMQFRKGYGVSQEDYLVGGDKLMRSDSFLDPKKHSLKASFANPDSGSVDTQAVKEVFSGREGVKIINDYNGNKVLSAYAPVKISENITWALISEIDESEVLTVPNELRNIIILISLVIFILITIMAIVFINTSLVKPLKEFQDGLLNFFAYLNREKKEVELLNAVKEDEIGSMARVVNENIKNIQKGINEDNELLDDAEKVLVRVKNGWYSQPIEKSSSNPSLENLKNDVNEMIKATRANFEKVNSSLQEYSNYDYRKKLVVDGIEKGGVFEHLIIDINKLRDAITEMLVDNKKNGMIIDDSSSTLLSNVDTLNQASNAAAASLEETAAALEEITGNVSSTTERIAQMSNFAKQVTDSASQGQELATKTTTAMDEINEQVSSINEAITVIDQIAFQTNILSLNAAVEAATAGEAGKGFAVVAAEVRNLASRSAEAAKEIKTLVENANTKANEGKSIADEMIEGYTSLNTNIDKTIELIGDVSNASKEQESGIVQINDAINSLDQQTQKNAEVANQTRGIAVNTSQIASKIVNNANEKEFDGKNSIDIGNNESSEARSKANPVTIPSPTNKVTIPTPSNVVSDINRPIAASPSHKTLQTISSNSNDNDEWESF